MQWVSNGLHWSEETKVHTLSAPQVVLISPETSMTANDQNWRSDDTRCDFWDSYMLMLLAILSAVIENY